MEVNGDIGKEKGGNFGLEWKKLPAKRVLEVFREVIPNASIEVQKEKVLFVEGKKVNYEEERIMFVLSTLEGENQEKLKITWRNDINGKISEGLEFEGEIDIAHQKIEGENDLVLLGEKRSK